MRGFVEGEGDAGGGGGLEEPGSYRDKEASLLLCLDGCERGAWMGRGRNDGREGVLWRWPPCVCGAHCARAAARARAVLARCVRAKGKY